MTIRPLWSLSSIASCFAGPLLFFGFASSGTDNMEKVALGLLGLAAGALIGFVLAIVSLRKKESPRWLAWAALSLNSLLAFSSLRFII